MRRRRRESSSPVAPAGVSTKVAEGAPAVPGVSTSILCVGLVAGAIECFWRSARADRDESRAGSGSGRRWRLAGAALLVAALGLVRGRDGRRERVR